LLDGKQVFSGIVCANIAKVTGDVTLQVRLRIHPVVVEMLKHAGGGKNLPQSEQGALALHLRGFAVLGWLKWVAHGNDSVKG